MKNLVVLMGLLSVCLYSASAFADVRLRSGDSVRVSCQDGSAVSVEETNGIAEVSCGASVQGCKLLNVGYGNFELFVAGSKYATVYGENAAIEKYKTLVANGLCGRAKGELCTIKNAGYGNFEVFIGQDKFATIYGESSSIDKYKMLMEAGLCSRRGLPACMIKNAGYGNFEVFIGQEKFATIYGETAALEKIKALKTANVCR